MPIEPVEPRITTSRTRPSSQPTRSGPTARRGNRSASTRLTLATEPRRTTPEQNGPRGEAPLPPPRHSPGDPGGHRRGPHDLRRHRGCARRAPHRPPGARRHDRRTRARARRAGAPPAASHPGPADGGPRARSWPTGALRQEHATRAPPDAPPAPATRRLSASRTPASRARPARSAPFGARALHWHARRTRRCGRCRRSRGHCGGGAGKGAVNNRTTTPIAGISIDSTFEGTGARVAEVVSDGPAAKTDLKAGEVVTKINGEIVQDSTELIVAIRRNNPGDTIVLTVKNSNGNEREISVVLGSREEG